MIGLRTAKGISDFGFSTESWSDLKSEMNVLLGSISCWDVGTHVFFV